MTQPLNLDRIPGEHVNAALQALWPLTRHRWPRRDELTDEQYAQLARVAAALFAAATDRPPQQESDVDGLATRLHDAACSCGEQSIGTWNTHWRAIARAAITELRP